MRRLSNGAIIISYGFKPIRSEAGLTAQRPIVNPYN